MINTKYELMGMAVLNTSTGETTEGLRKWKTGNLVILNNNRATREGSRE